MKKLKYLTQFTFSLITLLFSLNFAQASFKFQKIEDIKQNTLELKQNSSSYEDSLSSEQLNVLRQLEKLDFDPSQDATDEDYLAHPKSFEEITGVDVSSFYEEAPLYVSVVSKGATYIDVNLTKNRLTFYRNGAVALSTHISHGRAGKRTPTGTFSVGWKDASAYSARYKAPMPYSLFFIGGLYAIHQGDTSSQSRGCVRVPKGTASKLYSMVPVGTSVRIHY